MSAIGPHPMNGSAMDMESIIEQLQTEFAPRISADDPIRTYIRAYQLVLEAGLNQNIELAKVGMSEALADAQERLEASGAEKLKVVNDELIRSAEKTIKATKATSNEANRYLIGALVEMKNLVDEMKAVNHGNTWRERSIGLVIAAVILVVGFFFGRLRL